MAKRKKRSSRRRSRSNLGLLNLNATDRTLVTNSATAAISAVLVQKGFDFIEKSAAVPSFLKQPAALNAVKVGVALALLKTQRSELAKSAASGMIVSAVYDIGESVAQRIGLGSYSLSGYTPAPRLSTSISEMPNQLTNKLSGYAPVPAQSTGLEYIV